MIIGREASPLEWKRLVAPMNERRGIHTREAFASPCHSIYFALGALPLCSLLGQGPWLDVSSFQLGGIHLANANAIPLGQFYKGNQQRENGIQASLLKTFNCTVMERKKANRNWNWNKMA